MICGIGIDIIEIERVQRMIERYGNRLLHRAFGPSEIAALDRRKVPYPHCAGRLAAKEAVMKALGTGWGQGVSWRQIEILNAESGAPVVHLSGRAAERLAELGGTRLLVSISHSQHYAVAQAVIEGGTP